MDFNYPLPFPHNKDNKKKRGLRERKRGRVVLYPTSKEIKKIKRNAYIMERGLWGGFAVYFEGSYQYLLSH